MTPQRHVQAFGLSEEAIKRVPKGLNLQRSVRFAETSLEAVQLPLKKECEGETSSTCVPTPTLAEFRSNLPVLLGRVRAQNGNETEISTDERCESSALAAQRAFLARQSHRQSRAQSEFVV